MTPTEELQILQKATAKAFGDPWRSMDKSARDSATADAYLAWIETGEPLTAETAKLAANAARRQGRAAADREVGIGEYASDEIAAPSFDPVEAMEPEGPGVMARVLHAVEQRPDGKLRSSIIRLHLGEALFPAQPRTLLGRQPRLNLEKWHPGTSRRCPTCRSISRFLRARGLTPAAVGRVIDTFIYDAHTEDARGI